MTVDIIAAASALDNDQIIWPAALDYLDRGWRIVPIKPGEKRPLIASWPDLVVTVDTIPQHFDHGEGLGVILGRRSGDLADIDLDCVEAITLADLYLPVTRAQFGRQSKRRSHRLYIAPGLVKEAFRDPVTDDTLLELRGDGRDGSAHQTVFPPSIHPSGEPIAWHGETIEARPFDPAILRRSAAKLATACLVMRYLGQYTAERPGPEFPRLLWEFDNEFGRAAYRWLEQPPPDNPPARLRPQRFSDREFDLSEVVRAIPNNFDWEGWNRVGMAIWNAAKGSHAGFQIFDDFSARHAKYNRYDVEER
jgi:hypothetical protein